MVGDNKLEVVPQFRYLNDMLSVCNGHRLQVCMRQVFDNFCLFSPYANCLWVYSTCMRSVMLHQSETQAVRTETMNPI